MFDWQTFSVLFCVTLAAVFLAVRGWRVVRKNRAPCEASCGGCAGGDLVQLVATDQSQSAGTGDANSLG